MRPGITPVLEEMIDEAMAIGAAVYPISNREREYHAVSFVTARSSEHAVYRARFYTEDDVDGGGEVTQHCSSLFSATRGEALRSLIEQLRCEASKKAEEHRAALAKYEKVVNVKGPWGT